jgi:hypothetical protein
MTRRISKPAIHKVERCSLVSAFALAIMLTGCGGTSNEVFVEAHGKVLVDGKPAPGALVTLVPKGGNGARPSGLVKDDGSYEILTYDPEKRESSKGAIVGEYDVIVTWVPQPGEGNLEGGSGQGDRLKGLYRDPSKSNLRVAIMSGTPDLGSFELTTSGKR